MINIKQPRLISTHHLPALDDRANFLAGCDLDFETEAIPSLRSYKAMEKKVGDSVLFILGQRACIINSEKDMRASLRHLQTK